MVCSKGTSCHKDLLMQYNRNDDPNEGIVSAYMTGLDFLLGLIGSLVIVFLVVGIASK